MPNFSSSLDDEAGESVEQIITAARHITALVDEFLDIARIEAGAIPLTIDAVAPSTVAIEVVNMAQPLAAAQSTVVHLIDHDRTRVAKQLVELMHGTIDLTSEHGAGTTFTVTLPASAAAEETRHDDEKLQISGASYTH
jgi:signal transduction histidine kinase